MCNLNWHKGCNGATRRPCAGSEKLCNFCNKESNILQRKPCTIRQCNLNIAWHVALRYTSYDFLTCKHMELQEWQRELLESIVRFNSQIISFATWLEEIISVHGETRFQKTEKCRIGFSRQTRVARIHAWKPLTTDKFWTENSFKW